MTLTIIGKKIFADIIELKISSWVHPGLSRWVLNPMTGVLFREMQEGDLRQKRSGGRDCFLKNKYQHRCLLHWSKSLQSLYEYFGVMSLFSVLDLSVTWGSPLCGFGHDGCPLWTRFFHPYMKILVVPAAQGHDEGQESVRHQRLYNSQATSGHRHFWFVPHNFSFFKFEFVANLQWPGDFTNNPISCESQKTCQPKIAMK